MLNTKFEGYTISLTSRLDVASATFLDEIYKATDGVQYDVFINALQVVRALPGIERLQLGSILAIV